MSAETTSVVSRTAAAKPAPTPPAPDPAPETKPAPKPPKTVVIEIYGDDAMYGMTSQMGLAQQTQPAAVQALLRAQFGDGITVVSKAMGGTASSLVNMMKGVDGGGPPFAERIKASKADIILTNHAINDNLMQSLAPYADGLIAWIQAVRDVGKIAVLEEPNPVCDGNHPWLENYVDVMANTTAAYKVPLVKQYGYVQGLPNWQSHMNSCFYPDEWMLQIKAQRQAEVLAPLVKNIIGEQ
ncbi:conserved hypothetical protein [Cupriavidus necator]|uniref:SGNH/GDSL hydrolase family protein n=1 Tax=Cupriavidus necator TaxID=106590 RepID=A0A1K0IEA2_CUPNE|nr:conserved hypothetical protein [Cupriavidus necator]